MSDKSHVILRGSNRAKGLDATRVGDVDPKEKIDVTIGLAGPDLPEPDERIGETISPDDFLKQYGASKADADKVAKSLKKLGLKVDEVSLPTRSMRVSGTAAAIEAAFKPGLSIMRSADQGEYLGRQGPISIPAELNGIVTGVFGLDQRRMARRKLKAKVATSSLSPLKPSDIEQRYNFPPGDGSGQSIAIAEFGGGYFEDDLEEYCNEIGRSVPKVKAIAVDAPAYTLAQILKLPPDQRKEDLDASVEVMMDVQIVAGLCPKANISVLFSSFDQGGWVNLLNAVISAKPVTLSVSWGLAEDSGGWSKNARDAINDRLNMARLLGITVCISSGDDGSGDELNDGRAHVDFPSSSPFALSVGGTMLAKSGASVQEVTWWEKPGRRTNKGGGSTGGGVSKVVPRPSWQNIHIKPLDPGNIDGRVIPDVAAVAGSPLYFLVFVGKQSPNGGTSASAPVWAALIARVDAKLPPAKRQRFLTPLLYTASGGQPVGAAISRDITVGNNASYPQPGKGYSAAKGFDAVSGWGVPDGQKLLAILPNV